MTDPAVHARRALRGRRVVLGVTGGIAAYKAVEVCRRLVDAGAHVAPVLTDDALRFVGALTFSALASEPARTSLFDGPEPIPHTRLGPVGRPRDRRARDRQAARQVRRRDLRRPAHRHAARDPRAGPRRAGDAHRDVGAPGGPGEPRDAARAGACTSSTPSPAASPAATSGDGRLADPGAHRGRGRRRCWRGAAISPACACWSPPAGTREPIDPVRFVGNRSSGKMGHAVADAAAAPRRSGHARHHHGPRRGSRGRASCGSRRPRRWPTRCSAASPRSTSS